MPKNTLYVTGFNKDTKAADLAPDFEQYGDLVRLDIPPPRTDDGEKYAFVEYKDYESMEKALDLDGKTLPYSLKDGLVVQIARSDPYAVRAPRGAFRGGYAPRGGYGDRGYAPRGGYGYAPRGGRGGYEGGRGGYGDYRGGRGGYEGGRGGYSGSRGGYGDYRGGRGGYRDDRGRDGDDRSREGEDRGSSERKPYSRSPSRSPSRRDRSRSPERF
ncbi:hypothetical protein DFJ63DRAFT_316152 [Scheffersomyces coipomensis]|uniref:uncharacterized protein n=1 Tax=Scheffersomyces coipomensis TaxID=1788519 RepID=UPI00315CC0AE